MIIVATKNQTLKASLSAALNELRIPFETADPSRADIISTLYRPGISSVIVDAQLANLPDGASTDFFNGLGHRLPVIVLQDEDHRSPRQFQSPGSDLSDTVTICFNPSAESLIATLDASGALGTSSPRGWKRSLSYYNPHVSKRMLVENRSLGILTIDASSFRKIEVEYGSEVYRQVKDVFQDLLSDMWGKPGCFRSSDVLCRRSDHGNIYYVFLNRSRTTGSLPLPGVLEDVSDRLARIIQNYLLAETFAPAKTKRLPSCIKMMPKVVVGYSSAVHNPCLDPYEIVSTAMDHSAKFAQIQQVRNHDRYREMMTTLIQTPDLLVPHFQAVFRLPNLSRSIIEEAQKSKSIAPLTDFLFGFESLIRVRVDEVRALMGSSRAIIDPAFLRPDVLFETAKMTKVALELDQSCLNLSITYGKDLPGFLMINILPRNLYYLRHLKALFLQRGNLILEVSESETINNVELVQKIKEENVSGEVRIAADDFGKAFAGLDRIIEMRPELIKFDRSLIENIHKDPVKHAYVTGLVNAARMLNTEVLAEGVELIEELEVLQKLGIDYVQGFLLHRPQDVQTVQAQLYVEEQKLKTVA
jgi:EAL domain-containing protein (putative c-di-GMP-specific phosphodiesterase class I)